MNWITLIIVGVVLLLVAWYLGHPNAPSNPPILRWLLSVFGAILLVIGLILFVVWIAGAPAPSGPPRGAAPFLGFLLLGTIATDPPVTNPVADVGAYVWQYWLNAALVILTVLAVIENVVMAANITGTWLGLSDVVWHWVLFGLAIATALNTAFNHTPQITKPPTKERLARLRAGLPA